MDDRPLIGGNNARHVVKVGRTVHRSRGPRADFVRELLLYLESAGFPYAPRHLGTDGDGHDMLTYIPGETTDHPGQRAPRAYAAGGRILRQLHDVTRGHQLAADRECVVHGDPGPFNTIFRDGLPVGLIDWDSCGPGSRLEDLGYMAWTWCIQSVGRVPIADQARHLRELRDGYGHVAPEDLLAAIVRRQVRIAAVEAANVEDPGLPSARRRHARRAVEWANSDRTLVEEHRALLLAALR